MSKIHKVTIFTLKYNDLNSELKPKEVNYREFFQSNGLNI